MKNHIQDSKLSQINYNKIKFPLIQMSTKASACDKNADIFKKWASVQKSTVDLKKFKIKDSQLLKKLKIVSLIKNDHQTLKTNPNCQSYVPYKRTLQTQMREYSKSKQKKSIRNKQHKRLNTHSKNGLSVQKVNLSSDLVTQKCNQHNQKNRPIKGSLTSQIYYFESKNSGKRNTAANTDRVYSSSNYIFNTEQMQSFLTQPNQQIQMQNQQDNQLSYEQQKLNLRLVPIPKLKFGHKKNFYPKIFNKNPFLNSSIRGWTKYKNFSDFTQLDQMTK